MPIPAPDLRRTWLFGPGADADAHEAMRRSGADALILDLEDFTPPARRDEARRGLADLTKRWRDAGRVAVVRINSLNLCSPSDASSDDCQALASLYSPWQDRWIVLASRRKNVARSVSAVT